MMDDQRPRDMSAFTGAGIMPLSGLLFGYFGFNWTWIHQSPITGQVLPYVVILEWTLKVSAVSFVIAALLTMVAPVPGNLLYSLVSLLGAACFIVVAIWDFADPQHQAMSPILVLLFGLWNGFGSVSGLRQSIAAMRPREAPGGIGAA